MVIDLLINFDKNVNIKKNIFLVWGPGRVRHLTNPVNFQSLIRVCKVPEKKQLSIRGALITFLAKIKSSRLKASRFYSSP